MSEQVGTTIPTKVYAQLLSLAGKTNLSLSKYIARVLIEHLEGKEISEEVKPETLGFDMDKAIAAELGVDDNDEATAKDLL